MGITLHIRQYTADDAVVVRASGELDLVTAPALERSVEDVCAQAAPRAPIVVDLRDVSFLGAAGLGMLVRVQQRCRRDEHPLRVVATRRAVLLPMSLTGLDQLLEVVPSVECALRQSVG
jgi:anti-anti-sigma factor